MTDIIIYVNLYSSAQTAAAPWDDNAFGNAGVGVGQLSADLLDESSASTGIALDVTNAFTGGAGTASTATADNIWPEEVFDYGYYTDGTDGELQLSGLTNGDAYSIELAGHASNAARDTTFTVGVETPVVYDSAGTGVPNAPITIAGTISGTTLDITAELVSTFGYINGFKLTITPAVIGPVITDIDTNDDVFPGQSADITGTDFGGVQGDVSLGGVAQTVTAWADTEITITVVQSGLKYGDHDLIVTDDSAVSSAALTTTLSPTSTNQFVNVSSPVSDNTSLFFGASPAVVTGDQLEAPLLTTQGKTLTINADGTFVITDATGEQTFSIRVWDATDETWSTSAIATINGEVTPPSSIGGSMARAMVNG